MSRGLKLLILVTVSSAVLFGFFRDYDREGLGFKTLHIFLFNLTAGGTLILTHVQGRRSLGPVQLAYFLGALVFSAGAFTHVYWLCIAAAPVLAALVESVRWRRFAWFPDDFFKASPASHKFEQASLLCLSSGLVICAASLLNNHYLGLVDLPKLNLHVFYLGFSFPISLITFAYMFRRLEACGSPPPRVFSEFSFWALNLGVIFFFVFIVAGVYPVQLVAAIFLFTVVILAIYLHANRADRDQKWALLANALAFLTVGSLSGIAYVLVLMEGDGHAPGYTLHIHSSAAVFGWNLTWMLIVGRKTEFPIGVRLWPVMVLHWAMVLLMPLSRVSPVFLIPSVGLCVAVLGLVFFAPPASPAPLEAES